MSFQVSVSGSNLGELRTNMLHVLGALGAAQGVNEATVAPVTQETAPKATRKPRETKAEKEAQAAPLANGLDDSNLFADTAPTPVAANGKVFSKDDVNDAITAVLQKKGGAEARKLLGKYGATSTGGVKIEDYPKIVADAEQICK